jgi:hypothetical protein
MKKKKEINLGGLINMWMIESNGEEKPWAGVCCLYCSIENGWEMMIII